MEPSMRLAALQFRPLWQSSGSFQKDLQGQQGQQRMARTTQNSVRKYASQAICICTPQTVKQNLRTQQTRTTSPARNMLNYQKTKNKTRLKTKNQNGKNKTRKRINFVRLFTLPHSSSQSSVFYHPQSSI